MDDDLIPFEEPRRRRLSAANASRLRRLLLGLSGLVLLFLLLYYPVGAFWVHRIDDDTAFTAPAAPAGASQAVAVAAALVLREVDVHRWVANDPFFLPGAMLDNMPNYQQGMVAALARFAVEMTDQIGRSRGSSQADPDLEKAAGLLKYPGTVWIFDPSTSWAPTASSETQYRAARRALLAYNERLAAGDAVFERRADNLLGALERIAADLGSASAVLDRQVRTGSGGLVDTLADDIFYNTKGRLYAYALLLRDLGVDFAPIVAEREMAAVWGQMTDSMAEAAALQPWVVVNGSPDAQFLPSHLAAQGFFLMRARTQLREITNILLK